MAAEKDFTKTAVDLVKDRVAQQLISEREGIDQTLAAQEQGFVRQAKLLKEQLAATKDAGDREKVKQQMLALGNEAARADSGAAAARAKIDRKSTDLLDDYKRGNDLVLERIQREAELALMNERQRAVAQALYKVEDDGQKIRERAIRDITDETERTRALATVDALLAEQKEKVAAATEKSIDSQREFSFGWGKAFESYADSAQNAAKTAQDAFSGMTGAMEGAIKSFVKTGKFDFKSFGDAVINTLVDIQMQSLRTNVLAPLMKDGGGWLAGLFGGGSTSASASAIGTGAELGFASILHDGGIVGRDGGSRQVPMSLFSGAQRFHSGGWPGLASDEVPAILQRGERVLKRGEASEGGNSSNVTINIDASGTKTEGDAGNARELGRRIESAVRSVLMVEQRPGGMLA
jgi:lambda family phage tail tape measure protein